MTRILFTTSIKYWGGGERWMLDTASGLGKKGYEVLLVCVRGSEIEKRAEKAGLPTASFSHWGDFNPYSSILFSHIAKKFSPDIIFANNDKEIRIAGAIKRRLGIPLVRRRGSDLPYRNTKRAIFTYKEFVDWIVANSVATYNTIIHNNSWVKRGRMSVIYNGIPSFDIEDVVPFDFRKGYNLPDNAVLLGTVGMLTTRKGHAYLIEAFSRFARRYPVYLFIVGEGKERENLERLIHSLSLDKRVFLTGFREDILSCIKGIDIYVHPSFNEGFGYSIVEAMLLEKPVVASDASSIPELVFDGVTGFLFPAGDVDALAGKLESLILHPESWAPLGVTARLASLKNFSYEKMLAEYERLILNLI